MTKQIVIVEGPAGAGKSTVISALINAEYLHPVPTLLDLPRPRAYETRDSGAGLSQLKDVARLSELIASEETPVYMDRGFVSQHVYQALRTRDEKKFNLILRTGIQAHVYRIVKVLHDDYWQRRYTFNVPYPVITWLFVLPPLNILKERRMTSKKQYPYPAEAELSLYSEVYYKFRDSLSAIRVLCAMEPGKALHDLRNLHDLP